MTRSPRSRFGGLLPKQRGVNALGCFMSRVSAYRYRAQAADCRAQAELSRNQSDKDAWLVLASDWIKLAEGMDWQAETRPDRSLLSPIPGRRVRPMQLQGEMDKKVSMHNRCSC